MRQIFGLKISTPFKDSLVLDIQNWVDGHFTSGVALKKKEKYERKVEKLTGRFQNFFEKCGFDSKQKNKNGKERKRRRVTRDTTASLEQLGLIFKGIYSWGPFLHLKFDENPCKKRGFSAKNVLLTDFSNNLLISDKIMNI